jgi:type IV pilus assembly protein PilP
MYNYFATIRNWIVFAGCFFLLFSGCEKQADTPESKKVISKKIVAPKSDAPKAEPRQEAPGVERAAPEKATTPPPVGPALQEKPPAPPVIAEQDVQTPPIQKDAATAAPEGKKDEPAASGAGPSVAISKKAGDVAYAYDPTGKTDPFAPIFREKSESPAASEKKEGKPERKPMTPLEQIALSQLKLVAVMIAPSGNKALVEEVSGKGYIIHEGTYIGTNSGRVLSILLDKVVVEEEVEDVLGNLTTNKTEMKLQKTPGE